MDDPREIIRLLIEAAQKYIFHPTVDYAVDYAVMRDKNNSMECFDIMKSQLIKCPRYLKICLSSNYIQQFWERFERINFEITDRKNFKITDGIYYYNIQGIKYYLINANELTSKSIEKLKKVIKKFEREIENFLYNFSAEWLSLHVFNYKLKHFVEYIYKDLEELNKIQVINYEGNEIEKKMEDIAIQILNYTQNNIKAVD